MRPRRFSGVIVSRQFYKASETFQCGIGPRNMPSAASLCSAIVITATVDCLISNPPVSVERLFDDLRSEKVFRYSKSSSVKRLPFLVAKERDSRDSAVSGYSGSLSSLFRRDCLASEAEINATFSR